MSDQGSDWMWGEPDPRFQPKLALPLLPGCELCGAEVKPGEDYCWGCLGESIDMLPYEWDFEIELTPGAINYVSDPANPNYPVYVINSSYLNGITITNSATLSVTSTVTFPSGSFTVLIGGTSV